MVLNFYLPHHCNGAGGGEAGGRRVKEHAPYLLPPVTPTTCSPAYLPPLWCLHNIYLPPWCQYPLPPAPLCLHPSHLLPPAHFLTLLGSSATCLPLLPGPCIPCYLPFPIVPAPQATAPPSSYLPFAALAPAGAPLQPGAGSTEHVLSLAPELQPLMHGQTGARSSM